MAKRIDSHRRYDLDLLRYLQVLVEEESVSQAARRLKVSDAAMSRHLATLRIVFGDPILVLSGRRMMATSFANRIRDRVHNIVREADALVNDSETLNLRHLSPRFTIRANDLIVGAFGHAILMGLKQDCPNCSIVFSPETEDPASEALRSGRIDLYIGGTDDLRPEIMRQALFLTPFRAMVREGHPIFAQGITPQTLVEYDHISVSRKGRLYGPIDTVLQERYGLVRPIAIVVPTYHSMIETVRETDMILPLPDIVIDRLPLSQVQLAAFDFPFNLPPVATFQAWHPRVDSDGVHCWLRDTVLQVIRRELVRFRSEGIE
ncbi:LysR family transcriptional regulator [Ameyamaea chiangmaiensis NBRC 103196]|uniref:LysR family transcriptional regulator n=1 Tax=Ameyamaea chiangmaiensis TaxID=442969 RepID=A0A850PAH5_9PROT|nr:LysR family transcriptional regulator [Ameyamaea chiangmaiensis]MBS4076650.1 LysR family transcriptional regulator [Ameyamaea chiangmaiensis]NVN41555.1 LysR family transcriptional regulator [Ameyamaea chiangmaiensis]GBQ62043.1 LysR family transcriptional regulator [Ameyamaea chiangmaiensis NBRC 103196]